MDQETQASPGGPDSAPRPEGKNGKTGKNILGKGANIISAHSSAALILIIILVAAVVYLYARQAGWFGAGDGKSKFSRKKGRGKKGKADGGDDDEPEDPETSRLIDSINNSQ